MQIFSADASGLLLGRNLIEASAGTGKTYSIALIVLRLIIEKKIELPEILAVTFTNAAAEELKDRIRSFLKTALDSVTGNFQDENFIHRFVRKISGETSAENTAGILRKALSRLDEACADTIHGFCLRTLRELAFETGMPFEVRLEGDESEWIGRAASDFFRQNFIETSPEIAGYLLNRKVTPETFAQLGKLSRNHNGILPDKITKADDIDLCIRKTREAFVHAQSAWEKHREELPGEFYKLSGKFYKEPTWMELIDSCRTLFSRDELPLELPENFFRFDASSKKENHIKSDYRCSYIPNPFFIEAETFRKEHEALTLSLKNFLLRKESEFLDYLPEKLRKWKEIEGSLSFSDLIVLLHKASAENGKILSEILQKKYRAVLIDEFQDTDRHQFEIFQNLFPKSVLFFIGDPKQSIYSFRGADIHFYEQVLKSGFIPEERRFAMSTNFRSEASLVKAVNRIFTNSSNPFLTESIRMTEVEASGGKPQLTDTSIQKSLIIWYGALQSVPESSINAKTGEILKPAAQKICAKAAASEIIRLLSPERGARIGERKIRPRDIAVLVRKGQEARIVKDAFRKCGIPAVLSYQESVMDSEEALDLYALLRAAAEPSQSELVKGALLSGFFGKSSAEVAAISEGSAEMDRILENFQEYRRTWHESGFAAMMEIVFSRENLRMKILSGENGERSLTNYEHIAELITANCYDLKNIPETLKTFVRLRDESGETAELKLESDEDSVRIITVHKSKGLEFPVVFAPFLWNDPSSSSDKGPFIVHTDSGGSKLVIDPGSENEALQKLAMENKQEDVRLAYVAMTRASSRLYIFWGRFSGAGNSSLAGLFHPDRNFTEMSDSEAFSDLEKLNHPGILAAILPHQEDSAVYRPDIDSGTEQKAPLTFTRTIYPGFRISSFTALTSGLDDTDSEKTAPDRDSGVSETDNPVSDVPSGIFTLAKGAGTGTALHAVLENLDFTRPPQPDSVRRTLKACGLVSEENDPTDIVCGMASAVSKAKLLPVKDNPFSLNSIGWKDRIAEMEFHFPLSVFIHPEFDREFQNHFRISLRDIPDGFMKGFIDLVFRYNERYYIVDWKSNHLGNHSSDYSTESIRKAMRAHSYDLQYTIYTAALDKFLKTRLPDYSYERHFGGVFYFFLRGIEADSSNGIFTDFPEPEFIRKLSGILSAEDH